MQEPLTSIIYPQFTILDSERSGEGLFILLFNLYSFQRAVKTIMDYENKLRFELMVYIYKFFIILKKLFVFFFYLEESNFLNLLGIYR